MPVEIALTRGYVALVDEADAELVGRYRWHAHSRSHTTYAVRNVTKEDGTQTPLYMHRAILSAQYGTIVDHADGNGLNNQRHNLRFATTLQNTANRHKWLPNKHGFPGVIQIIGRRSFYGRVTRNGRQHYTERFDTAEAASYARDELAVRLNGDFARPANNAAPDALARGGERARGRVAASGVPA
jgi:hypothetical protein